MEWLFGLAILPALLCGLVCLGGMAVAAIGLRRSRSQRPRYDDSPASGVVDHERVTVHR